MFSSASQRRRQNKGEHPSPRNGESIDVYDADINADFKYNHNQQEKFNNDVVEDILNNRNQYSSNNIPFHQLPTASAAKVKNLSSANYVPPTHNRTPQNLKQRPTSCTTAPTHMSSSKTYIPGQYNYNKKKRGGLLKLDQYIYTPPKIRLFIVMILTVFAFFTRVYNISEPAQVVFDEVHFGGHTNRYIKGEYFFDVHPPLGKLMFAGVAKLAGYDGSFTFKDIGMDYDFETLGRYVPYREMRMLSAVMSTLMVPLAYFTVLQMGFSVIGATLAATMVLLENSFVTQFRFILLDAPLLFFIVWTMYAYFKFRNLSNMKRHVFSYRWYFWLASVGAGLGLSLSVKWVGLFVVALIGSITLRELWDYIGDLSVSFGGFCKHFFTRLVLLFFWPIFIYVALYYLHFSLLPNEGPGMYFMDADFRSSLNPVKWEYSNQNGITHSGSRMKLKHSDTGLFLHSHPKRYRNKGSSRQQQVTGYGFQDDGNNVFCLKHASHKGHEESIDFDFLKSGDTVVISHPNTYRALYVHGYRAPVTVETDLLYEVSAYDGPGDEFEVKIWNADWQKINIGDNKEISLYHKRLNCHIFITENSLPKWGGNQREVVCAVDLPEKQALFKIGDVQNLLTHQNYEVVPTENPRTFWKRLEDVYKIQILAWQINNGLTGSHPYMSRPYSWPILERGINYWTSGTFSRQIYLIGNPIIFAFVFFCFPSFLIVALFHAARNKRGVIADMDSASKRRFESIGTMYFGYFLHYFPFWLMERQLFFHHYLPAHYFAILTAACFFDHVLSHIRNERLRCIIVFLLCLSFLYAFNHLCSLSYSTRNLPRGVAKHMRWRNTWDMAKK